MRWRERIPDAEDLDFDAAKARAAGSALIQVIEVLPVLFGELLGNPNEDSDFQTLSPQTKSRNVATIKRTDSTETVAWARSRNPLA